MFMRGRKLFTNHSGRAAGKPLNRTLIFRYPRYPGLRAAGFPRQRLITG